MLSAFIGVHRRLNSLFWGNDQLRENPRGHQFASLAGFSGGADTRGATRFAGAGGQQAGGLAEQFGRQAIERGTLADAAGIHVVEIEVGLEDLEAARDLLDRKTTRLNSSHL